MKNKMETTTGKKKKKSETNTCSDDGKTEWRESTSSCDKRMKLAFHHGKTFLKIDNSNLVGLGCYWPPTSYRTFRSIGI